MNINFTVEWSLFYSSFIHFDDYYWKYYFRYSLITKFLTRNKRWKKWISFSIIFCSSCIRSFFHLVTLNNFLIIEIKYRNKWIFCLKKYESVKNGEWNTSHKNKIWDFIEKWAWFFFCWKHLHSFFLNRWITLNLIITMIIRENKLYYFVEKCI